MNQQINRFRNITLRVLLGCTFIFSYATAQDNPRKPVLTIKGSDTMVILVQRWTEMFPDKSKVQFQVTGGGSGTGISALINGTTDICSSSRPMKPSEVKQIREKYKYNGLEVRVARDGIAVYLNVNNPVQNLTIGQVKRVYTGEIVNWKELGGNDAKIVLYSRENNSGTYEFFKEHVLQKQDFASQTQHMVGTGALVNAVAKDPNAIGFGGIAYASGVKPAALAFNESSRYVLPKEEEILSGNYPVSRLLYFYLKERPSGLTKEFIDWVISKSGQDVVNEVGYLPTKKF
ncbi:MAG: phosphate ABC transporter substrate-binding protein [Ignavibacteria bacterium]|jgi:phosphate transport system substrate-binding protein|nr:phosphate ABC transporter substrate-binding protein [Ignavibacteria bacterium]MBL7990775.1 phosphate ABC transporter substrate-binding protein [Candidatus Kapabacteria bacterium]